MQHPYFGRKGIRWLLLNRLVSEGHEWGHGLNSPCDLYGHIEWMWNHPGDRALCMLVGEFVGKVSWGGKPHPKCGWHCSVGWTERRMLARYRHLSLYWLTSETAWLSLVPFCSQGEQQRPSLPQVFLVRHLVTTMRIRNITTIDGVDD